MAMDADSLEICALLEAFGDWKVDVGELNGPGRFTSRSSAFDLEPGTAFDLRHGYDFTKEADRTRARTTIEFEKPLLVVGSPVCAPFSNIQTINAAKGVHVEVIMRKGIEHLIFCAETYKEQYKAGLLFLHEQPATAKSWNLWVMREVSELPGVHSVQ